MSRFHADAKRHAATRRDHGVLAWVLGIIAAGIAFVPSFYYFSITGALEGMDAQDVTLLIPPESNPPGPPQDKVDGQWINILLMGSDSREGENAKIGGEYSGLHNDTTILVHISADRTRIELISIPRDSRVRISDCNLSDGTTVKGWTGKFNNAFQNGGKYGDVGDAAACVIRTVQDLTGIYISEYIVVDFMGLSQIINILGGVPMCIPFSVTAPEAGLHLNAGPQILDGWSSVAWARARKFTFDSSADRKAFAEVYSGYEGNGFDMGRIRRQQELIGKVFEVLLAEEVFYHPAQMTALLEAGAQSMTVSPNLKQVDFLIGLAWSIKDIDRENIVFLTVPNKLHENESDVVWLKEADAIFASIAADEPIDGKSVADFSNAAPVPAPSTSPGGETPSGSDDEEIDLLGACTVD